MTVYNFTQVLVWDNLGGSVKVARNQRVNVTDPSTGAVAPGLTVSGQPVSFVTSDSNGHVSFAATIGTVTLTGPNGFSMNFQSPDAYVEATQAAADAASAKTAAANSATAAQNSANLVGAPAGSAIDAYMAGSASRFRYAPGAGTYTGGDVVKIGANAYNTRPDVGTSIVAGGAPNYENVIGGNLANVDTGTSNLTGAPTLTNENGNWNALLGGYDTVVNGWANSVVGFHCKVDVSANHCTIAGGSRHSIAASTQYGVVGGGTGHSVSGASATVAGGTTNTASGNNSTVGGGNNNASSGSAAVVSGGSTNTASGPNASVGGGNSNAAAGSSSTVAGGLTNTATGTGATVAGGRSNAAWGDYSTGLGYGAIATQYGETVRSANFFANAGDAQTSTVVLFRQTTDATASDLRINNAAAAQCPENTTWVVRALVVARRTDVAGENAAWRVEGVYKRDMGNTGAWVGTPTVTSLGANSGNVWTVTTGSFSPGNARIIVTGEAAKTIRWVSQFEVVQVQQPTTATRAASTAYTLGQRVLNGTAVLQCVIAGTTAATAPTNPAAGAAVADGTVTWLRTS